MIPLIENSLKFKDKVAIVDAFGTYSYSELYNSAKQKAGVIHRMNISSEAILYMVPSGFEYISTLWAIWMNGKIAVPIHIAHPKEEIEYLIEDTEAELLIYEEEIFAGVKGTDELKINTVDVKELSSFSDEIELPELSLENDALMIYTSGTTGRPKGVVISHRQLDTQIRSLTSAWKWTESDRILNVLPMHHVHGLVNISCCALYNGAILEMQPKFSAEFVADRMSSDELSLFMAVPTIYHKLIQHFENLSKENQIKWQEGMRKMRLMVSGSAALPIPVLEKWKEISGHTLLERYGMTEIGMALSNPLEGERRPGTVGQPLPFVSVKIMNESGKEITDFDVAGELYVKGDTVFKRYWNKPKETAESFESGWFKTGDVVEKSSDGYYKILGRKSADIIKSGGYKISALEIENVLLIHSQISECAVVGLADEEWGEVIGAAIVGNISEDEIPEFLKERLADYKKPRMFKFVSELPRNAMGKIRKTEVKKLFDQS